MNKACFLILISLLLTLDATATPSKLPSVTHYSLKIQLFPKEGRLEASATMTVTNGTDRQISELPFLLYRLLAVRAVSDDKGTSLPFDQTIARIGDGNLQANLLKIHLPQAIAPQSSTRVSIRYSGSLLGYAEVMAYVRDRVSEKYSLIRPDALAYPALSDASFEGLRQAHGVDARFTYDADVTVPHGYVVACVGDERKVVTNKDLNTFTYNNHVPTWRIDIAAANFKVARDEAKNLSVFVLPEDEQNAQAILNGVARAVKLYSDMFGATRGYRGYTVIEIPDGWGSQAGDSYLMQSAAAFKDLKRIVEVYHEVAHTWNAKAKPEVQRSRWFDEAFAMYFQALALREFEGQEAYVAELNRDRESFIKRIQQDKQNSETPIAEYAKYEIGANSYSKGAWTLYVLHQLVGEETFRQIIRVFLAEFHDRPADFRDFRRVAERVSHKNLQKFFDEWIFGAVSSRLMADRISLSDIVRRY